MAPLQLLQAKDSGFFEGMVSTKDSLDGTWRETTPQIPLISPSPTPRSAHKEYINQQRQNILTRRRSRPSKANTNTNTSPTSTTAIAASHVPALKLSLPESDLNLTLPAACTSPPPALPPFLVQSPREHLRVSVSLAECAHIVANSALLFLRHEYRPATTPDKRKTTLKQAKEKESDNSLPLARKLSFHPCDSWTGGSRTLLDMAGHPPQLDSHDDIFLELANDGMASLDDAATLRHSRSYADKRRSIPSNDVQRPSTSGSIYARPSTQAHNPRLSSDLMRQSRHFRSPSQLAVNYNTSPREQDGHARRHTLLSDPSPLSPSRLARRTLSPELSQYGRRQPSFGGAAANAQHQEETQLQQERQFSSSMYDTQEDTANGQTEAKGPDSASTESQSAETVWDELDELKSRIKRLELTGKPPALSSAAISGGSSGDRPRTATTAPTTIDSSPKQGRKVEQDTDRITPTATPEAATNTPSGSNIHPLLHQALAKAKPLLNPTLYRSLVATANDALQLAAMTGATGPQGTTYSAASFMNGMGSSDRNVRRKADNMCRNLTDLCLALCEGKHEVPRALVTQPSIESMMQSSPSSLQPRSSLRTSLGTNARPMSRLEARRSSILGSSPPSESKLSPRCSFGELPSYDQDATLTQNFQPRPQRGLRSSLGSAITRRRTHHLDDVSGTDEEGPSARPVSRAATEVSGYRTRSRIVSEQRPPMPSLDRSPALREALASQRSNDEAHAANRSSFVGSLQRVVPEQRFRRNVSSQQYAPAMPEEESDAAESYPTSRPPQRVTSLGRFSSRRAATESQLQGQGRSPGLQQRRHVIVE